MIEPEFDVEVEVLSTGEYRVHCPECDYIAERGIEDVAMTALVGHLNACHFEPRIGHA